MFEITCRWKFLTLAGLALIMCAWVTLESKELHWFSTSHMHKHGVENIISLAANRNASVISDENTQQENTPIKIQRSIKDGLLSKLFRHAGQLRYALQHLLASENISENNVEIAKKNLREFQLPLINDIFNSVEEIIQNDDEDLKVLQKFVSDRIYKIQNPTDCSQARKLICNLDYVIYGLGCILHHLADCFIIALGTNRTLIADASAILYKGWSKVFKPLSICADDETAKKNILEWQDDLSSNPTSDDLLVVQKTIRNNIGHPTETFSKFVPFAMPAVIADKLSRAHNQPNAWWMGQLFSYMMRLQPWMLDTIDKTMKEIGFSHPIVCVHVRRTDKILSDAIYRDLSEFMIHVNYWYEQYELKRNTSEKFERKVYLATDDYGAVIEAKTVYTNFKFLHDPLIKELAGPKKRFTEDSLIYSVREIIIMSQCDYFVGTLSSNFGRTVYQLMQAKNERTYDMISLDIAFNNMLQHPFYHEAIADHLPQDGDVELKVGDKITLRRLPLIFHKGYGRNQRTNRDGFYPMMKVKRVIRGEKFAGFG